MRRGGAAVTAVVGLLLGAVTGTAAGAAVPTATAALRQAVTAEGISEHLQAFQTIAEANDGNRAAGTSGYDDSVTYVVERLTAAGYDPVIQAFPFAFYQKLAPGTLARVSPDPEVYAEGTDFETMDYSGSGDVTAPIQAVDVVIPPGAAANTSTSGCETSDFAGFQTGNIALIQRGTCTFETKVDNAEAAGASAVIIFNEGQAGRTGSIIGTLGNPQQIPAVFSTFALGEELYTLAQTGEVIVRVTTSTVSETRTGYNVLADTEGGREDRTVVVGAHLDSVAEGPGINDNGTGSGTVLEIAEQFAALGIDPVNQVRFAFWGAEESGLLGSEYYVSQLSAQERKDIAVNLNFDMVGSTNYVRFVYDGDGNATGTRGPAGSHGVERLFVEYFQSQGLPTEPTAFDGRSDYGPFIAAGIPAGGLFTGAEGIKTAEQQAIYGGTAGQPYDPCYHAECDTWPDNVNLVVLEQMADAAAHATLTYAMTTSAVSGAGRGSERSMENATQEFKGPRQAR